MCLGIHVKLFSKDLPSCHQYMYVWGLTILFKHIWSSLAPCPGGRSSEGQAGRGSVPGPRHAWEVHPSRKAGKSLCLTSFDLD